jgi:hypothetical protein
MGALADTAEAEACRHFAWRNVLLIQNFFPRDDMCCV